MNNPIELLEKTELLLFSLSPSEALELKAKTQQLVKDLPLPQYQSLAHQISFRRKVSKNFLAWLACACRCAECEDYEHKH